MKTGSFFAKACNGFADDRHFSFLLCCVVALLYTGTFCYSISWIASDSLFWQVIRSAFVQNDSFLAWDQNLLVQWLRGKRNARLLFAKGYAIMNAEGGDSMKLGSNIRTLRQRKGLTQEQVAAHLGVSYQAVSKWETGVSQT